jgi:hypothetical protein
MNFLTYQIKLLFCSQPQCTNSFCLWPPYAFHPIPVYCCGNGSLSTCVLGQMFRPQLIFEAYKAKISPTQPLFKDKSYPGGPKIRQCEHGRWQQWRLVEGKRINANVLLYLMITRSAWEQPHILPWPAEEHQRDF